MIASIEDLKLKDRRVFIRADLNVPLDAGGNIIDDSRILASLPTLRYALEHEAKIILASHLGRPKGQVDLKLSLLPIATRLAELLECEVLFPESCVGDGAKKLASELKDGQILLLENLRFEPGEKNNDPQFAEHLASYAQVYINDAFGALHRAHASTEGIAKYFPERAMGLLVKRELEILTQLTEKPDRPFWAILGGAKVSDKLEVLGRLLEKVDGLMIGGAMAYTFLKAQGKNVGDSLVEDRKLHQVKKLLERAKLREIPVLLPVDHVIAQDFSSDAAFQTTKRADIPSSWKGVDIGPNTLENYADEVQKAKTVLWNGPLGVFEIANFAQGTLGVARALAKSEAISVVGGGDSLAAIQQAGVADKISHLSTGGGATLNFLEGKALPGLVALENPILPEEGEEIETEVLVERRGWL